jgi:uncharacterized protein
MTLLQTIQKDMKDAMLNKEKEKLSTLRLLLATIEKKKVEKKLKDLTDVTNNDILESISKNIKVLDQEIESLENVGRDTSKQQAEKALLTTYLPKQLTQEEIEEQVRVIVSVTKRAGGNIGVAMKEASAKMKGKADMKLVSELVKKGMKN